MHKTGNIQPHTTVEAYGVHHIITANNSFMEQSVKDEVESIVSHVLSMEAESPEQNQYLENVLQTYYHKRNKYELIHLIRKLTLAHVMIRYVNVPFFRTIVRDFSPIVREARNINPIKVITH